jgi:hypothetical protein
LEPLAVNQYRPASIAQLDLLSVPLSLLLLSVPLSLLLLLLLLLL